MAGLRREPVHQQLIQLVVYVAGVLPCDVNLGAVAGGHDDTAAQRVLQRKKRLRHLLAG